MFIFMTSQIAELSAQSWYIRDLGGGWRMIRCSCVVEAKLVWGWNLFRATNGPQWMILPAAPRVSWVKACYRSEN